jgi:tRNA/rRNA methyltransferase/tRNA (cytidine32/uridine32-2'-O)-methyltransferase
MTPPEAAAFIRERGENAPGNAALVFGCERTGLDAAEIALCNFASHIPASESFPSLNLSHAVMIYTYELFRAFSCAENPAEKDEIKGRWIPLDQKEITQSVNELAQHLQAIGFYKQVIGKEEQKNFFRDILSRAAVSEKEAAYFSSIITKAARLSLDANEKTDER